jgi:hypothetical protein
MVRTQIQLTEDQYRQAKRAATRLGISLAEAIRRSVAEWLRSESDAPARKTLIREALEVCGKYEDPEGFSRVATEHDKHLSEAFRR